MVGNGGVILVRKFLSFLGTTNYEECTYEFGNLEKSQYHTKFVQEALLNLICKDWTKEDTAVIFLTKQAEKENWYNQDDENRRLKTILGNLTINVKGVSIPEGKTEEEIWQIFNIVNNMIDDGDEIIFDITHSFRSIPMLALVVLNYAKIVKNATILGIYYGEYDRNEAKVRPMHIIDLTPLNEILEWAQAVNVFLKYGISGPFRDISIRQLKPHLGSEQWARDTRQFIESLNNLTMCLYTCRGKSLSGLGTDKKSISAAAEAVNINISKIKNIDEDIQLKPLIPLMDKIEKKLEIFHKNDNLNIGLAAVKWSIEHNLIQQAYTAFDETIVTYVCLEFGLDSSNNVDREEIAKKALRLREKNIREDEWDVKREYWDQVKNIYYKLDSELVSISNSVSAKRNDVNHFGFRDDASKYPDLINNIKECFNRFLDYINNANLQ